MKTSELIAEFIVSNLFTIAFTIICISLGWLIFGSIQSGSVAYLVLWVVAYDRRKVAKHMRDSRAVKKAGMR